MFSRWSDRWGSPDWLIRLITTARPVLHTIMRTSAVLVSPRKRAHISCTDWMPKWAWKPRLIMVYQGLHPKSSGLSSFITIFLTQVAILGAYPIFRHKGYEAICIRRIKSALFKTSEIAATVYPNNGYLVRKMMINYWILGYSIFRQTR